MSEMDKTKVLHIVGALNLGGAETMIMNIFRNIDRSRFQFDFYLSGDSGGFYEEEVLQLGGRILNVGRRKKHPVKYCTELFKLIRKEKYDAVQIHATDAQDGLPAVVARLAGAKKGLSVQSLYIWPKHVAAEGYACFVYVGRNRASGLLRTRSSMDVWKTCRKSKSTSAAH